MELEMTGRVEEMGQINIISKRGVQRHGIPEGNSNFPSTGFPVVATGWGQDLLPPSSLASPTLNHLNPNQETNLFQQWPQNPKEHLSQPQFMYPARQWNPNFSNERVHNFYKPLAKGPKLDSPEFDGGEPLVEAEVQKKETAMKSFTPEVCKYCGYKWVLGHKCKQNQQVNLMAGKGEEMTPEIPEQEKREPPPQSGLHSPSCLKLVAAHMRNNIELGSEPFDINEKYAILRALLMALLNMVGRDGRLLRSMGLLWNLPPWPHLSFGEVHWRAMGMEKGAGAVSRRNAYNMVARQGKNQFQPTRNKQLTDDTVLKKETTLKPFIPVNFNLYWSLIVICYPGDVETFVQHNLYPLLINRLIDGEIEVVFSKQGNYDLAAKSYERVCALISAESWEKLLAEVLPDLAECQKNFNDEHGYLASCVKLLSLESAFDVSSLITFAVNQAPPIELCDGDPGTLSVAVWSGFPDNITLESLSLRLLASSSVVEGPVGTDEFMSCEKPTRPVLKVRKPRALVDITPAVSSALLMNELQWIGLIVKPIDYSLKDGILHIDAGAGLKIEESQMIEIENYRSDGEHSGPSDASTTSSSATDTGRVEKVPIDNGKIKLPDWASDVTTLVWFPVRAIDDTIARGTSTASPQKQSIVDRMRMIALKLEFGAFHNQVFERTIAVHFTNPFHVSTRVVDKCNDGTLLLQVMLHSEVKATLHVKDVWLDLQAGFEHLGKGDGRPTSSLFPLVIAPPSRAGILFVIRLSGTRDLDELEKADSMLNIKYRISGDRTTGAHSPVPVKPDDSEELLFKIALKLKRPVLDPCLAVGFLPFSTDCLRVGQLVDMKWRVERLKNLEDTPISGDELLYQVDANPQNWMIAGRKCGHISLSKTQGSRIEITVTFVPLVSGYVHPPQLGLPDVGDTNISCNPAGPHLVCVLPPTLSTSYCIPA